MKKIFAVLTLGVALFSCAKNEMVQCDVTPSGVRFIGSITDGSKVSLEKGASAWEAGDTISLFSVAKGADPGVSVGVNYQYVAASSAASTEFVAVDGEIPASDIYYAYSPVYKEYPYKVTKNTPGGVPKIEAGTPLTDYRYMPVVVNKNIEFEVNENTGLSKNLSDSYKCYYAVGTAPEKAGDPVQLEFVPVLPVLEFGILGTGTLSKVVIKYVDSETDKLDAASNNWMTAKGVFNMATGVLVTTNTSANDYCVINATVKTASQDYVTLSEEIPVRLQFTVGRFTITKGLSLTFYDKDNNTITKKIWTDETVSMYNTEADCCKHIYQPVALPAISVSETSLEIAQAGGSNAFTLSSSTAWTVTSQPDWVSLNATSGVRGSQDITVTASANTGSLRSGDIVIENKDGLTETVTVTQDGLNTAYYTLDLSGVNWSASNVHYVKDQSSSVIAMVTKEYFGGTVNKQGVVVYPAPEGTPDYTKGFVAELTLDGGSAVSGNVHGGSVSFTTMKADDVVYTAGTTSAVSTVYVIDGGHGIAAEAPAGTNLGAGALEPLTVVTDVRSHPCTKTGIDIWMAENYQTTKFVDGNSIPRINSGDKWPTNTAAKGKVVIVYEDATYGTQYLYSEWAMGFTSEVIEGIVHGHFDGSNFAPEGWHVPSSGELLTDLFGFMGSSTWENMSGQGLMNWNKTAKANSDTDATVAMLAYGSIWTSSYPEGKTSSLALMCGLKPDNSTVNSQQKVRYAFCTRLIKD